MLIKIWQLFILLLPEIKCFAFVTTFVTESNDKKVYKSFIQVQKLKQLLMKVILMMYFHQFKALLYQLN